MTKNKKKASSAQAPQQNNSHEETEERIKNNGEKCFYSCCVFLFVRVLTNIMPHLSNIDVTNMKRKATEAGLNDGKSGKEEVKSDTEDESQVTVATVARTTGYNTSDNKLYGIRTKEYQHIVMAKGVHNGRAVYSWPFEDSLKSAENANLYSVHMLGIRRGGDLNMAMKLPKLNKRGQTIYVNQTVFVRKMKKGTITGNTTESLKTWAGQIIKGIQNQNAKFPVKVVWQADITETDSSNELLSADSVLMDEDVIRLVNARYKSKVDTGEFFNMEERLRVFFSYRRSIEEIRMLFV